VPRLTGGPARTTNIALCHEWIWARHGSEKTFEAMAAALPRADLYGLTWNRAAGLDLGGRAVTTTFIDRITPLRNRRDLQLPLMPLAWRYASRADYQVVVTSSHACAKGFWPARRALHLCYCYTPMRYLWLSSVDMRRRRDRVGAIAETWLRRWDLGSATWVDEFAAISTAVQTRIQRLYGRAAQVIHPPVDTGHYTPSEGPQKGGFVLAASRMVPYKRLDLAIRACNQVGVPLVVAGAGPEEGRLRTLAAEVRADVTFVIEPDDDSLRDLYRSADLLVFPAEEDFGIVPVEAQACGTPVVAYGRGGALDTVVAGQTGVLVEEQSAECLAAGIETAITAGFDRGECRRSAERFSRDRFQHDFLEWVRSAAAGRGLVVAGSHAPDPA